MSDSSLLAKLPGIWQAARRRGGGLLADNRPAPGGTRETAGYRDYSAGDDYRQVDWDICARHDELRVRQFRVRPQRHVHLLIDCSQSMSLGRPARLDVARQVAAALGYVALAGLDRVAAVAFTDRIIAALPPLAGKERILRLIAFLDGLAPQREKTSLAAATREFAARRPGPGLAVIVSDFYDPAGVRAALGTLRRAGCGPRLLRLDDPRDAAAPPIGDTDLLDVESGRLLQFAVTPWHRAEYTRQYTEHHRRLLADSAAYGVPLLRLSVALPAGELLRRAVCGGGSS